MFLVLLMIFHPASGWEGAARASHSAARVLAVHLLPMLLLGCVAEGAGMMHWGKAVTEYGGMKVYGLADALRFEACQFMVGLAVVWICTEGIKHLSQTFHGRHRFGTALTVSVFSLGPAFLMRVCDAFPAVHPMLSWVIGAVLGVSLLYQGVPRLMAPGSAHTAGVFLASATLLFMVSGIGRVLVVYYLQGRILGSLPAG